jgi:demethylmenaquinone methyltransferase/2-methoxy-6-polyprenyl-1,4-benzoquinol methylase
MPHASAEMRAYYAARAPYYDAVYAKPERAQDLLHLQAHIPERLATRSVLEVACGTGYWTQFIALRASSFTATDWTPEPLGFARLRPNTDSVAFVEADAYALPEALGLFDGAFAGLWFSHVPVKSRALFFHSLHSRLKPGARILLLDNSDVQCREHPIVEHDAEGNTYQHRQLRDGAVHRVLKNFPSASELSNLVSDISSSTQHTELQNFWLFEYELKRAP